MLNGAQFVEAIGRIGYPGAASLNGSEFDWLFDCAPENLHFMRSLLRAINPSNAITAEEARAFQELRKSGKPLLDEAALSKVLKTMGASDGSGGDILGPSSNSSFVEESDVSIEDLEAELQALRNEKELKQHRYNKLQVLATSRADVNLRLAAERESASSKIKEADAAIRVENAGTNASLQSLADEVKNLGLHLFVEPESKVQEGVNGETSALLNPSRPHTTPVLLSQLSIEPYLQQEELNTKTLTTLTQKQFFEGISDIVSNSSPERFQVLDLSSCGVEEEEEEEEQQQKQKEGQRAVDRRRKEMAMLQWSHLLAEHQLLMAKAQEKSIKAGIDWLSAKSSLVKSVSTTSSLQVREAVSRRELQAVEAEIDALLHGPVPAALREAARLVNVPVVRGDLALQLARQDYYTSRQDQVRDYLLRQKSSFDLLLLALEMELRNWKTLQESLETMRCRLVKAGEEAAIRMEAMAHPDLAINPKQSPIISSKDAAFSRLLQLLEAYKCNSGAGQAEPFHTYEALDQAARNLTTDLQSTREALAGVLRQLSYTSARLSSDYNMLHDATHTELQQLVVEPQVCPTALTDQELCPNAQELSVKLVEVESQLKILHHVLQNTMDDVKAKRSQLERNFLRRERELYVYFHLDPLLLQRVVEDREGKVANKAV